jgi:predicted AlkP superfamily phosphohydrolase/phosphomutase
MVMKKRQKVLVIGLDGATWEFIEEGVKDNKLVNLKKLIESGSSGILESTIPPLTIPAWPAMFTGKNPDKLGAYDFIVPKDKNGNYEFVNSSFWRSAFVWDILSRNYYKVAVLNVPGTYPPYPINGIMITGMLTPDRERFTYPPELKKKLKDYDIDLGPGWEFKSISSKLRKVHEVYRKRCQTFRNLLKKFEFDFVALVFNALDVTHHFIDDKKKIEKMYEEVDRGLKWFIKKFENEIIFVVSDHGLTKIKKIFFINDWLERKGFLKRTYSFSSFLFKYLPPSLLSKIAKFVPKKVKIMSAYKPSMINFRKTKAFSLSHGSIIVRDNSCIQKLIKELKNVKYLIPVLPEANKIHEKGRILPDIILDFEPGYVGYPSEPKIKRFAEHIREGIFVAHGSFINKKEIRAKIIDITPTILHIFGISIPHDIDGRILHEIFYRK